MRAVVGYEEKDPAILRHLSSGYPRFVLHPYLRLAAEALLERLGCTTQQLWLTGSARSAAALAAWLAAPGAEAIAADGLNGVAFPTDPTTFGRAKTWLQHTGASLSPRAAEDLLVALGRLPGRHPEARAASGAEETVRAYLRRAYAPAGDADLFLAPSGMNAVWGAFRAVSDLQAARGRRLWIQWGWLYLDTIAILQKFTASPADAVFFGDVFDLESLRRLLASRPGQLAGIITEVPTNPLIQTPDLPAVHRICREHGGLLVVDPSVASPVNLDVLPHADVVVNSLTKYTASEGDVLFGAAAVNPSGPDAAVLRAGLARELEPVHAGDLARLAAQIGETETVVAAGNRNARAVVDFLRAHPRVATVHWSLEPRSRPNYLALARSADACGSMISFTVKGPVAPVYDALRLPKGPSFGMKTTLLCPFMYLAHYDLVTSEAGRSLLAENGLSPDLLRLSVGCEPIGDILDTLREALAS
jgi:cystathionine beta-lyase/cystathionine gamma-synthase